MPGMARRLSSPVFIGRSSELQTLLATADLVASGQTAVTLIGGEAGVGKSRLVAELAGRLTRSRLARPRRAARWRSATTDCRSARSSRPCAPCRARSSRNGSRRPPGPACPSWRGSFPSSRACPTLARSRPSQADWLQVRIFEGILRLLGRLGDTNPILLIVEDAHWADRSTRDLLAFLARNGRDERLFIVATFRSDELHRRHPLTGWLAEAERQARVERIDLTRFERDELVEMIGMIAGDQLGPSLVDSIARRSDGNAFFAEELVAATESSRSSHDGLPDTLRGVLLMVRLAGTSEDAGHLVEIAAVAGREVEHDVLAEVCGLSETDLSRALHEALDAQLLFVTGADGVERYALPSRARAGSGLRPAPAVGATRAPWRLRASDRGAAGRCRRGAGQSPRRACAPLGGGPGIDPRAARRARCRRRVPDGLCLRRGGARVRARDRAVGRRARRGPTDRPRPGRDLRLGRVGGDRDRRRGASGQPRPQGDRAGRCGARRRPPTPSDGRAPASSSASHRGWPAIPRRRSSGSRRPSICSTARRRRPSRRACWRDLPRT